MTQQLLWAAVVLAVLGSLAYWVRIRPSGAAVVVAASVACFCFAALAQISQLRGAEDRHHFLVLAVSLAWMLTPGLLCTIAYLRRQARWALAGIGLLATGLVALFCRSGFCRTTIGAECLRPSRSGCYA